MIAILSIPRSGSSYLRDNIERAAMVPIRSIDANSERTNMAIHNLIRCHDFRMDFVKLPGFLHVFQHRDPEAAILSWFDVEVRNKALPDTAEALLSFAPMARNYITSMHDKWASLCDLELPHHELSRDSVIRTLSAAGIPFDASKIQDPRQPTKPEDHRYYHVI
jgi:hypothetical protein